MWKTGTIACPFVLEVQTYLLCYQKCLCALFVVQIRHPHRQYSFDRVLAHCVFKGFEGRKRCGVQERGENITKRAHARQTASIRMCNRLLLSALLYCRFLPQNELPGKE
jgi:hypothetical protein